MFYTAYIDIRCQLGGVQRALLSPSQEAARCRNGADECFRSRICLEACRHPDTEVTYLDPMQVVIVDTVISDMVQSPSPFGEHLIAVVIDVVETFAEEIPLWSLVDDHTA